MCERVCTYVCVCMCVENIVLKPTKCDAANATSRISSAATTEPQRSNGNADQPQHNDNDKRMNTTAMMSINQQQQQQHQHQQKRSSFRMTKTFLQNLIPMRMLGQTASNSAGNSETGRREDTTASESRFLRKFKFPIKFGNSSSSTSTAASGRTTTILSTAATINPNRNATTSTTRTALMTFHNISETHEYILAPINPANSNNNNNPISINNHNNSNNNTNNSVKGPPPIPTTSIETDGQMMDVGNVEDGDGCEEGVVYRQSTVSNRQANNTKQTNNK